MTSPRMGRLCIEEARGRMDLIRLAAEKKLWSACVREAQEYVALAASVSSMSSRGKPDNGAGELEALALAERV